MNPVRKWRERLGLDRNEAAIALGISESYLGSVERGVHKRLGKSFRSGLRRLGTDPDELDRLYQEWRSNETDRVSSSIKAKEESS